MISRKGKMEYSELLSKYFSFSTFRSGQLETIKAIREEKRDVLTVLPTSTGKTLIFQYLTITQRHENPNAITVVISPLIALMIDQVEKWNTSFGCTSKGIIVPLTTDQDSLSSTDNNSLQRVATFLGSAQTDPEVEKDVIQGKYPVVYLAPEKLAYLSKQFLDQVILLVVDECHCISEHGKSFRPSYRTIRSFFPEIRTLALTATAPQQIETDILTNLLMDRPKIIRTSMYRSNLRLMVQHKAGKEQDLEDIKQQRPSQGRMVIFGTTRTECEQLAKALGSDARAYHAGLSTTEREKIVSTFTETETETNIIVATSCFGLGIDIPDIRVVIHYGLPRSLLGYVQECGRAGRDGQPAKCLLFYQSTDVSKYKGNPQDIKLAKDMLDWINDKKQCRHQNLLLIFGEKYTTIPIPCVWKEDGKEDVSTEVESGCDVCSRNDTDSSSCVPEKYPNVADMCLLLSAISDTGNYSGRRTPIDFLLGSRSKKVLKFQHKTPNVYGRGSHRSSQEWTILHNQLNRHHLIHEVVTRKGYVIYKLTVTGRSFIA